MSQEKMQMVDEEENIELEVANEESIFDKKIVTKNSKKLAEKKKKAAEQQKNSMTKESLLAQDELIKFLFENQFIDAEQINLLIHEHEKDPKILMVDMIIALGFASQKIIQLFFHNLYKVKNLDIKNINIEEKMLTLLPRDLIVSKFIIPLAMIGQQVYVAIGDIYDLNLLEEARSFIKQKEPSVTTIIPLYFSETDIVYGIDTYYGYEMSIENILREIDSQDQMAVEDDGEEEKNPVVDLIDTILEDSIKKNASDIHFEPDESFLRIRYRIDGVMMQRFNISIDYWNSMLTRLKIISNMDISERRHPQDGRISMDVAGKHIDFRVANHPSMHGENVVLRILDPSKMSLDIRTVGFGERNLGAVEKALQCPEGIILIVGPTGSGKTTTLYSMIHHINEMGINIMTIEDPVEYTLPLIRQSNASREGGATMTFEEGIRSLMRQDPDTIVIGEIRDMQSANLAAKAAMTGHQVLSSLHANNAVNAITRMIDIGVNPMNLADVLVCLMSQRLARRLCPNCKEKTEPDEQQKKILGKLWKEGSKIFKAKHNGCPQCNSSGYKGRVIIPEVLLVDQEIKAMISKAATVAEITKYVNANTDFISMAEFGIGKLMEGVLDFEELMGNINLSEYMF